MLQRPDFIFADVSQLPSLVRVNLGFSLGQLARCGQQVEGVGRDEEVLGAAPVRGLVVAGRVQVDLRRQQRHDAGHLCNKTKWWRIIITGGCIKAS